MAPVAEGVIPDPGGGGELAGDARPQSSPKGSWATLSEAEKAERSEKIKAGQRKAKEAKEGKRGGDSAPKPKATRAAPQDSKAADLQAIRELLGGILSAPSFVGAARGDAWLTSHFMQRGPELAEAIVAEAARNDAFRAYLTRIAKAAQGASLLGAVAMYVLPPLMHFGIAPGAELLGVPLVAPPAGPVDQARPVPGRSPQFVAPQRGPAEVVPERPEARLPPDAGVEDLAAWAAASEGDDLAAELREHEDAGGIVPPLPMEPV